MDQEKVNKLWYKWGLWFLTLIAVLGWGYTFYMTFGERG